MVGEGEVITRADRILGGDMARQMHHGVLGDNRTGRPADVSLVAVMRPDGIVDHILKLRTDRQGRLVVLVLGRRLAHALIEGILRADLTHALLIIRNRFVLHIENRTREALFRTLGDGLLINAELREDVLRLHEMVIKRTFRAIGGGGLFGRFEIEQLEHRFVSC